MSPTVCSPVHHVVIYQSMSSVTMFGFSIKCRMYKDQVVPSGEKPCVESILLALRPLCDLKQNKPNGRKRRFTFDLN